MGRGEEKGVCCLRLWWWGERRGGEGYEGHEGHEGDGGDCKSMVKIYLGWLVGGSID